MIADEFDALREEFEGCTALAFADLSTKMILVTDNASNLRREVLDDLCEEAALLLGSRGQPALGTKPSEMVIVTNTTQMRIFLRATQEPNDILCCICTPKIDVAHFVDGARACLERISGNE